MKLIRQFSDSRNDLYYIRSACICMKSIMLVMRILVMKSVSNNELWDDAQMVSDSTNVCIVFLYLVVFYRLLKVTKETLDVRSFSIFFLHYF